MSDEEWALIEPVVDQYAFGGRMGRPVKHPRRQIVDAILYVAATGCQWRALPECYPHWNTVHRYHVRWSRDGTWEQICDVLRSLVREVEGRDPEPSAGVVDARTVRAAPTVPAGSKGYDAGKKINGRKTFGIVDTTGLLLSVLVVSAAVTDNVGGIGAFDKAVVKTGRLRKIFCDSGFKRAFAGHLASAGVVAKVVKRRSAGSFEVLPRRWTIERTWAWIMNHRRLQVDYERDPKVAAGFVWAAHARLLLRRLTETTSL